MNWLKLILKGIVMFVILLILAYVSYSFIGKIWHLPLFVTLGFLLYSLLDKSKGKIPDFKGKEAIRYNMYCKDCGWEWISNTRDKNIKPSMCPNCHEKGNMEVIGWRMVSISPKKTNRDLRKFFK